MSTRKVVLITGASRGIGAASAIEFARRGYDLALTDIDATPLADVAQQAKAIGARVEIVAGDLADMQFVESIVDRFVGLLARLDVLVNNAAWRELVTMRQISVESWEKTLRICVTAPAFLARTAARQMERQKSGVIVNISSIMSARATGIAPAYVAAKGAMNALTYDLAALYGPAGVRVVSIQPGAVDTAMSNDYSAKTDQGGFEQRVRDWSEDMIALRRWAKPEEIARAIVAISGDDASYLTGTIVTVDGGWSHQLWPYDLKHEQHPDQFP